MSEWGTGTLHHGALGVTMPMTFPAHEGPFVAILVQVVCPTGCVHHLAVEDTLAEALEAACPRLEMLPHLAGGFLIANVLTEELGGFVAQLKEACDEQWRGRVN